MKGFAWATATFTAVYFVGAAGLLAVADVVTGVRDPSFHSAWQALSFGVEVVVLPSAIISGMAFLVMRRHQRHRAAARGEPFVPTVRGAAGAALVAAGTYWWLPRAGFVGPGRRALVSGALFSATVAALPMQLLVWWALGLVPSALIATLPGLLALVSLSLLPPVVAAAVCFSVAGYLLGRRRAREA